MGPAVLTLALAQAAAPGLVFASGVDLVQVVVSVAARDGLPVRDLQAKDFVIRENGRLVAIETFVRMQDSAGSDSLPVELTLLLDTSSSMSGELTRARDAIVDFARALPSFARGRILAFDRDASDRAFDAQSAQVVLDQMIQLKGGAGTRVFDAVIDGAGLKSNQRGRRVMVLFTDGQDSTSRRSLKDAIKALQASEVTCYVVSYASGLAAFASDGNNKDAVRNARRTLDALAQASGGFVVDGTAQDVAAQLERIVADVASSYVIGFTGAPSKHVERRRLQVEVKRRGVTVRHRESYIAKAH